MTFVELKLNLTRAIVLIAILIALSLVPVLSHNLVTGIFGSPEVQQNLIVMSFSLFSKDKEHKTFYIMAGRMTRWEIFSSKVFAGYIWTVAIVIIGGLFYYLLSLTMGYTLSGTMVAIWTARAVAGAVLFYQIGAYTSMLFSSQARPILLDIVIFAGLLTAGAFEQTKFLDFFQYMGGQDVLTKQSFGALTFSILLVIAAGLFVLQYFHFRSSDL